MLKNKKFQKRKEDFLCKQCGAFVKGDGYTDHCPKCLWSKHADINPGDRSSGCGGMMEPVDIETKNNKYIIYYKCTKCGYKHKVKSDPNDDIEKLISY
jgi:rubrerythrin